MKNYRIPLVLATIIVFMFVFTLTNFGLQLQNKTLTSDVDLAAWDGNLFIIQNDLLKKLDYQLQATQAVRLPSALRPLPPEPNQFDLTNPNPQMNSNQNQEVDLAYGLTGAADTSRLAADRNYVYALFEGTIFIFDHELNYIKSTPLN